MLYCLKINYIVSVQTIKYMETLIIILVSNNVEASFHFFSISMLYCTLILNFTKLHTIYEHFRNSCSRKSGGRVARSCLVCCLYVSRVHFCSVDLGEDKLEADNTLIYNCYHLHPTYIENNAEHQSIFWQLSPRSRPENL